MCPDILGGIFHKYLHPPEFYTASKADKSPDNWLAETLDFFLLFADLAVLRWQFPMDEYVDLCISFGWALKSSRTVLWSQFKWVWGWRQTDLLIPPKGTTTKKKKVQIHFHSNTQVDLEPWLNLNIYDNWDRSAKLGLSQLSAVPLCVQPTNKLPPPQASCVDRVAASRSQTAEEWRRPSKEGLQAPAQETGLCSRSHANSEATAVRGWRCIRTLNRSWSF